jgi:hypothetical protein
MADFKEQERLIKKVEALQAQLEADFEAKYPQIFKDLYSDVSNLVSEVNFSGNDQTRAKQLLQIVRLKKRIMEVVTDNQEYRKAVKEFTEGFLQLRDLTDEYFGIVVDGYTPKDQLYRAISQASIELTKDALLGSGVQEALAEPIVRALSSSLGAKSQSSAFQKVLKALIQGTETTKPILQGEIGRLAGDSMMFFNRSYIDTISADLNISYFLYSGTTIKTTRKFCASKVGRVYKKNEVENWANGTWQGKITGTDKKSIFTFAGGYRCRHTIWPATKEQYQIQKKREQK